MIAADEPVFDHNDLAESLPPKLPPVRVGKPDAAVFVNIFGACPCCGRPVSVLLRAQNNLLVAETRHT